MYAVAPALMSDPAPLSPDALSGLVLWLKSDVGLFQDTGGLTPAAADADPVGLWKDQSGNANDLPQATAGKRPLLKLAIQAGRPTVRSDGVDDFLGPVTFTLNQPALYFVAYKQRSYGAAGVTDVIFAGQPALGVTFRADTTPENVLAAGSGRSTAHVHCEANFGVATMLANGMAGLMRFNRANDQFGNVGANNPAGFTLSAGGGGTRTSGCDFGEVIVYSVAHPLQLVKRVEEYLRRRWATN